MTKVHRFTLNQPSDTFGWWLSADALGRSKELACDSDSMAIKCKTDSNSYQAFEMAVSCKRV